jgi:hypothetical protein
MAAETLPKNPIPYATPVRPDDVDVRREPGRFHVDLGPMPASLFVATLIPHLVLPALALTAGVGLFFAQGLRPSIAWAVIMFCALASLRVVIPLARHRHVPRTIGATSECVYHSDAGTRGRPDSLLRRNLSSIGVRRLWWQPWVFELVAVPKYKFLTLTAQETQPFVLLSGLDRAALEAIAAELRHAPESTPGVPAPLSSRARPRYTST